MLLLYERLNAAENQHGDRENNYKYIVDEKHGYKPQDTTDRIQPICLRFPCGKHTEYVENQCGDENKAAIDD